MGDMLMTHHYPAQTPTGRPLLIAHGLFGSARNWNVAAKNLATTRDVVTVDMRNHGESPWFDTNSYPDMAADLAEVIRAQGVPMDVLGHSMGGKAAMMLALTHPELVGQLVVGDIAPVPYTHDNTGHITAMRALPMQPMTRGEADRALAASVPDPSLRAFFLQSLDLRAIPPRWRLNLDVLQTEMPQIVGWPDIHTQFEGRTLFLSGGRSTYVLPAYRDKIRALFPHARFVKIPNAGHWLHADAPRAFEATVDVFLSGATPP
jgi:esterase